jgi:hypothetical protein
MVKEKLPCPRCTGSSHEPQCAVCHGRGTVRPWTLVVSVDWLSGATVAHLAKRGYMPIGVTVTDASGFPFVVLRVERHHISEAIGAACAALAGPSGEEPFVHRAW